MVNIEDLRRIDILQNMPFHILEKIAAEAQLQIIGKNTVLFEAGNRNEVFYMLTMGHVALKLVLTPDIDIALENLQAGSAFGSLALVKEARASYSASCQEACEAITLQAPRMFELFDKDHELAFYMIRAVANQFSRLIQKRARMTLKILETNPDLRSGMEEGVHTLPRVYTQVHI